MSVMTNRIEMHTSVVGYFEALLREALEAGAMGFSTGRSDNHRAADGSHTPAADAEVAELSGISRAFQGLESGVLVGLHSQTQFRPDFERFIALYTRSLFRGPEVLHIEATMRRERGVGAHGEHYLQEVVLSSNHTHHLTKVISGGRYAIMIVTPRRTDVAVVWAALRILLPGLESNLA